MLVNVYFNSEAEPYPPRTFRGSLQNISKLLTLQVVSSPDTAVIKTTNTNNAPINHWEAIAFMLTYERTCTLDLN